jgi:hypothetical protein
LAAIWDADRYQVFRDPLSGSRSGAFGRAQTALGALADEQHGAASVSSGQPNRTSGSQQFAVRAESHAFITRLKGRIAGIEQDIATIAAHADDPVTIGGRHCSRDDALDVLAGRLRNLPESVREPRQVELGLCRGLQFGLLLRPQAGPELLLEGATTCREAMARDRSGPRAIMNAVERLMKGYEERLTGTRDDLALAETQLRDYQSRFGAIFAYEGYLSQLTHLRNRLKAVLSNEPVEEGAEPHRPAHELADKIKALKAANTIDAAAERTGSRGPIAAVEPVTTRIRRRRPKRPEAEQPAASEEPAAPVEAVAPAIPEPASPPEPARPPETEPIFPTLPEPTYREFVRRRKGHDARQMSMF